LAERSVTGVYETSYDQTFDQSFRSAFRAKLIDQCVSSASKAAHGLDVSPTCTCAADAIVASRTATELTELARAGLTPELRTATAQCFQTNPPTRS